MTANRRSKRVVRSRMEQTGEKYTQARRALAVPDPPITWPQDSLGWFTDQAWNVISLADDEARMLSHPRVDPEHLLLAAARYGNVESLLGSAGISARDIHDAIVQVRGYGAKFELRPWRSPASEEVLRRAVAAAAAQGVLGPSTQHLLIGLGEQELAARILAELGVSNAQALVDARYPVAYPPVEHARLAERAAQLAASGRQPPSPGPMPPVFERFTAQARAAINAGAEYSRTADDVYVEPEHLLFGVLNAKAGVAAAVRTRYGWYRTPDPSGRPGYSPRTTGIFTQEARRIVAEDVLIIAERLDHNPLTTGHVLLAILERHAHLTVELIGALPPLRDITMAVIDALPGEEDT